MLDSRTLPNGLRLLTAPIPHARSATVSFYVGAGSRYEGADEAGMSHLVEHLCFKGSEGWPTAKAISEAIEGVGGVLNAGTDRELTVYYAKVPAAHLDLAVAVVADLVVRPVLNPVEFEKERHVILEELATVEDNPGELVGVLLDALLWPDQALGRDIAGTPESVRAISRERTAAYHRDQYGPANALVSVAGPVDPERVASALASATERWDWGRPQPWEPVRPPDGAHSRIGLRSKLTEQAHLMLGLPGYSAEDPDRYALGLLAGVLGDGMSSRLFIELREERALAYDVHAYTATLRDTGAFSIYLGVDPDNAVQALKVTLQELARLRQGVPLPELTKIREYTKGRMLLNMEDTRAVTAWYGGQALLQNRIRSVEEVVAEMEAVTQEDLVRVAERMIRADEIRLAIVGPFEDTEAFASVLRF